MILFNRHLPDFICSYAVIVFFLFKGKQKHRNFPMFFNQCRMKQQDSFTSYLSPSKQLHLLLGDRTSKIFYFFFKLDLYLNS